MFNIMLFVLYLLLVSLSINWVCGLIAYYKQSDKLTDLVYALTFALLTYSGMMITNNFNVVTLVFAMLVTLWALRLGTYLFIRINYKKKDDRFDNIRISIKKFLLFWTLQAFVAWMTLSPLYVVLDNSKVNFNTWSILFLIVSLGGLTIETIADYQKYQFKKQYPKKFITTGLFKISRHPNYFGEITFWMGLAGFAIVHNFSWLNLVLAFSGPIILMLMINFVSGVKMLEARWNQKYGDDPMYQDYIKTTPCVIPFIGQK